jgi:hypothetical protein
MKQINPKQQGDLDGLCGVHAIINALYAQDPTLTNKQLARLFRTLLTRAAEHRPKPMKMLWEGIDPCLLRRLLRHASKQLASKNVKFKHKRFKVKRRVTLDAALDALRGEIDSGWLVIASIEGRISHWTVIRRITQTRIYLLDSARGSFISIQSCTLKKTSQKYQLCLDEILLVRRNARDKSI